jgi:alcohol dehydrogenase YqhD (iron-dependent ADH family)
MIENDDTVRIGQVDKDLSVHQMRHRDAARFGISMGFGSAIVRWANLKVERF